MKILHHELQFVPPGHFDKYPEGAWLQHSDLHTGLGGRREILSEIGVSREEPDAEGDLVRFLREGNEINLRDHMEYALKNPDYEPSGKEASA